jgi:hypothetical protein
MITIETPHHEMPQELRDELETAVNEIGSRHYREINTPHPDNPNAPLREPNHRVTIQEIRTVRRKIIDRWNSERT